MHELARLVTKRADWNDLELPDRTLKSLHEISATVHQERAERTRAGATANGAVVALFTGDRGTGKTRAAAAVATDLGSDLLVVDLAGVVSKWIGETEKQLALVFDEAERTSAVLLLDEADALFGEGTESRPAEAVRRLLAGHSGLAILTTRRRASLDAAFTRRLRFVVHFRRKRPR